MATSRPALLRLQQTIALESNPGSGTLVHAHAHGQRAVPRRGHLLLVCRSDQAANGYTIQATTTGLSSATTNAFDITPAAASELVVTTQPPASTTAGNSFGLTVTAEDLYGNLTPGFTSSVTVAALKNNPGSGTHAQRHAHHQRQHRRGLLRLDA